MGKVDVYIGGYLLIDDVTGAESERLASSTCVIGMPLTLDYDPNSMEFKVLLPDGDPIGTVHPKNKLAIRGAIEDNWTRAAWLSLVYYDGGAKLFKGEMVYQMFNVKPSETVEKANLEAYTRLTSERLGAGKRPDVALTGTGWDQVVATGDWQSDKEQPLPINTKHNSGLLVFKRKRSFTDRLIHTATSNSRGCHIALVITIIVILVIVVILVWIFAIRG